jgi:NAD(P)H-hydrate epimerase
MRATDRAAIEAHGVPGVDLMARAAAAAELVLRERFPDARRVAVLCGGGNNGGDGLVVARLLAERGVKARVAVVASRPYAGDAAWAEEGARAAGLELGSSPEDALDGADVVVDALLGTGFTGAPRDAVAGAIEAIAASGRPVLALDVPSGVDASTGEAGDPAVRADVTVTFHAAKLGLHIEPGASHAGEVVVVDIGIPDGAEAPAPGVLSGPAAIAALPPRPRGGSKYDAGRVVVVAGSRGMTGACTLAGRAALRGGAGIVTACVAGSLEPILEVTLTEVMTRACPDRDGALQPAAEAVIREVAERGGPLVLGPGLGRDEGTQALVRALLDLANPLVLDADGLFALGEDLGALAGRSAPTVITPHGGEAGRLLGRDRRALETRRLDAARELARRSGAIALLKGPDTIVATPDGRVAVRAGDEPGLATAGTGDVLSGVIGALLARGAEPFLAAAAGAAAHLHAARAAVAAVPGRAIIAGDVVEHLRLGSVQP